MNFIEELSWRGMLFDKTPGVEELVTGNKCVGYIGFDPTAKSLTLGNYVQIMLLSLWQKAGHRPIVLMGGATGRIGDPSGKDKERQLKSFEELDQNLAQQVAQIQTMLDFEDPQNGAILINNLDFYKDMNVLDFMRNVGKTLTVNYMSSKESVKKRLETGISYTEFSYQLLQAYDFQCLYEKHDCLVQMGGSDQWGNITSGTEFIRRNSNGKAYAITTPLLTKSDGKKFGKSEEGNIWLDGEMTSPYKFYQFWLNADDADISKFIRYFTLKTKEEVEQIESEFKNDPRMLKSILAEELTCRIHGEKSFAAVKDVSELLFNKKASQEFLQSLDAETLSAVAKEIPARELSLALLESPVNIVDLIATHTDIVASKSEANRAIKGNALSLNKEKISSSTFDITREQLLHGNNLMIENGKKNKFIIHFS